MNLFLKVFLIAAGPVLAAPAFAQAQPGTLLVKCATWDAQFNFVISSSGGAPKTGAGGSATAVVTTASDGSQTSFSVHSELIGSDNLARLHYVDDETSGGKFDYGAPCPGLPYATLVAKLSANVTVVDENLVCTTSPVQARR